MGDHHINENDDGVVEEVALTAEEHVHDKNSDNVLSSECSQQCPSSDSGSLSPKASDYSHVFTSTDSDGIWMDASFSSFIQSNLHSNSLSFNLPTFKLVGDNLDQFIRPQN